MRRFLRNQGLTLVVFSTFLIFLVGQSIVGHLQHNEDLQQQSQRPLSYREYLASSHFLEATMENWESEFLQMFAFVVLTAFLFQKGSIESKDPDKTEEVDRDPRKGKKRANVPWPVKKGGIILKLYEYSLSLAFLLLFLFSFALHAVGGAGEYNREQRKVGCQRSHSRRIHEHFPILVSVATKLAKRIPCGGFHGGAFHFSKTTLVS